MDIQEFWDIHDSTRKLLISFGSDEYDEWVYPDEDDESDGFHECDELGYSFNSDVWLEPYDMIPNVNRVYDPE